MRYVYGICAGCLCAVIAYAQFSVLPSAGMTAKNPLYIFERMGESIGTIFTFGREAKITRFIILAEERLSEASVLAGERHQKTEDTIAAFDSYVQKAETEVDREHTAMARVALLESVAKHFVVFEEVLDTVSEEMRVSIEMSFEEDRKRQKRLLFETADADALIASELGFASIRERLARLKIEVERGRQYETAIITGHIKDLFAVLASAALHEESPSKEFLVLLSNDITRALESFDEIQRSPKYPSGEVGGTIHALKEQLIGVQISLSRNMIPIDPEFVLDVLFAGAESRIAAFDRLGEGQEEIARMMLSEYEEYLVFADEVETRTGRFILDREQNITIANEIQQRISAFNAQIAVKRGVFPGDIESNIDRIISR